MAEDPAGTLSSNSLRLGLLGDSSSVLLLKPPLHRDGLLQIFLSQLAIENMSKLFAAKQSLSGVNGSRGIQSRSTHGPRLREVGQKADVIFERSVPGEPDRWHDEILSRRSVKWTLAIVLWQQLPKSSHEFLAASVEAVIALVVVTIEHRKQFSHGTGEVELLHRHGRFITRRLNAKNREAVLAAQSPAEARIQSKPQASRCRLFSCASPHLTLGSFEILLSASQTSDFYDPNTALLG
jgi:hypothetical protein